MMEVEYCVNVSNKYALFIDEENDPSDIMDQLASKQDKPALSKEDKAAKKKEQKKIAEATKKSAPAPAVLSQQNAAAVPPKTDGLKKAGGRGSNEGQQQRQGKPGRLVCKKTLSNL